jgi:hypothetical protein
MGSVVSLRALLMVDASPEEGSVCLQGLLFPLGKEMLFIFVLSVSVSGGEWTGQTPQVIEEAPTLVYSRSEVMAWRADPKERLQSGHWLEALAHSEMQSKQKASVLT